MRISTSFALPSLYLVDSRGRRNSQHKIVQFSISRSHLACFVWKARTRLRLTARLGAIRLPSRKLPFWASAERLNLRAQRQAEPQQKKGNKVPPGTLHERKAHKAELKWRSSWVSSDSLRRRDPIVKRVNRANIGAV